MFYTISGDSFSVDRNTGEVTLSEPLDRETQDLLEVVVTVQDESFKLTPYRREIRGS